MEEHPHVERILDALFDHRLALFTDAELAALNYALATAPGEATRELRGEIEWQRENRKANAAREAR